MRHRDSPAGRRSGEGRIGELTELQTEFAVWSEKTNAKQRGVDWQIRTENALVKLKLLQQQIKA